MTPSREARIVFGMLLLNAAGFLWLNLLGQPDLAAATTASAQEAPAGSQGQTAPAELPDTVLLSLSSTPEGATVLLGGEPLEGVTPFIKTPVKGAEEATLRVEREGYLPYEGPLNLTFNRNISVYLEPVPPGGTAVDVVAPDEVEGGTLVAREILINELPFLVTAPPQAETGGTNTVEETDTPAEATTPQPQRRASVNPFAPIIVTEEAAPEVQVVPAPGEVAATITVPAPRPLTPPAPQTRVLPRALPGGSLPVAPEILQSTKSPPQPDSLAEVAAVRVPDPASVRLAGTTLERAAESELEPLAIARQRALTNAPPVTDGLSRYLSDNDVTFTGAVLGSVGVGVFRSSLSPGPIVVTLGQTLPETDIVLTELTGQQAELTQDNHSQTLALEPRR